MENNADLGVTGHTHQQLRNEQQADILAHLRARKRRAATADQPLLLSSGAEITKPELSSADLQFLENRKFSRSEICAAFGVRVDVSNDIYFATDEVGIRFLERFDPELMADPSCAVLQLAA